MAPYHSPVYLVIFKMLRDKQWFGQKGAAPDAILKIFFHMKVEFVFYSLYMMSNRFIEL